MTSAGGGPGAAAETSAGRGPDAAAETSAGRGPDAAAETSAGGGPGEVGGRLVTLVIGDTGRGRAAGARPNRQSPGPARAGAAPAEGGAPAGDAAPSGGPAQYSWRWEDGLARDFAPGCEGEPDLVLTISPHDAELVRGGELAPSVAFMQGRLKTAGDNALLLQLLAFSATPGFSDLLAQLTRQAAPSGS